MLKKMKATPKKHPVRIEIGDNLAELLAMLFSFGLLAFLFWLMYSSIYL